VPCGGTTTTTLPPFCTTFTDCTDDDRCTLKTCENGRCVSSLRPGYEGVDCRVNELLDTAICAPDTVATRLSRRLQKLVTRIRNLLEASAAASPNKSRKILARAVGQIEKTRRQVLKSSATPSACREHLLDLLEQRRRLIQNVS
jgi:hypothetical protein